jgi:hypothetical protein
MTTYHDDLRRAAAARPDTECGGCGQQAETITVRRAGQVAQQRCQACLGMADPEWRRLVTEGRSGE